MEADIALGIANGSQVRTTSPAWNSGSGSWLGIDRGLGRQPQLLIRLLAMDLQTKLGDWGAVRGGAIRLDCEEVQSIVRGEPLLHSSRAAEPTIWPLPHRIIMAPLTRSRARQLGNVPSPPSPKHPSWKPLFGRKRRRSYCFSHSSSGLFGPLTLVMAITSD